VGLGGLGVKSAVWKLLQLAPTTVYFQHNLDCFQALEMAKIAIDAHSWLRPVQLAYLEDCLHLAYLEDCLL
jgi:hypothetical protein